MTYSAFGAKGVEKMKVSDGYWLSRTGYDVSWAAQIYESAADDRSLTVWAATQFI